MEVRAALGLTVARRGRLGECIITVLFQSYIYLVLASFWGDSVGVFHCTQHSRCDRMGTAGDGVLRIHRLSYVH